MELAEGREYYWKRTGSWKWFDGLEHWWEIFVEVCGMNGVGGYWLYERWRWNGSSHNIRNEIRTLSYEESRRLDRDIEVLQSANAVESQATGSAEESAKT